MAKGHRARGDGGAMASREVKGLARKYAREVADLRGRGLAPSGEASALVALLRHADDARTFTSGGMQGSEDRGAALRPVMDRLVGLGAPAADAIMSGGALGEGWYSALAGEVLHDIVMAGSVGGDELEAVLAFCAGTVCGSSCEFFESCITILSKGGAASVPHLRRALQGGSDRERAVLFVGEVLEASDPSWAAGASIELLEHLMEERSVYLADIFTHTAALVAGRAALPLVQAVARRKVAEGLGKSPLFEDAADALEALGEDVSAYKGLERTDAITRYFDGLMGAGDRVEMRALPPPEPPMTDDEVLRSMDLSDPQRYGRKELSAACRALGLGDAGCKEELVRRIEDRVDDVGWSPGVALISRPDVMALPPGELRVVCKRLNIDRSRGDGDAREALAALFDSVRRAVGPQPILSEAGLGRKSCGELAVLCGEWDVSSAGRRADIVNRIIGAQRRSGVTGSRPRAGAHGARRKQKASARGRAKAPARPRARPKKG